VQCLFRRVSSSATAWVPTHHGRVWDSIRSLVGQQQALFAVSSFVCPSRCATCRHNIHAMLYWPCTRVLLQAEVLNWGCVPFASPALRSCYDAAPGCALGYGRQCARHKENQCWSEQEELTGGVYKLCCAQGAQTQPGAWATQLIVPGDKADDETTSI
jgi:hypothetical protein